MATQQLLELFLVNVNVAKQLAGNLKKLTNLFVDDLDKKKLKPSEIQTCTKLWFNYFYGTKCHSDLLKNGETALPCLRFRIMPHSYVVKRERVAKGCENYLMKHFKEVR